MMLFLPSLLSGLTTGTLSYWLVILILIVNFIFIMALIFMERADPRSTISWILVLILVPIIGFIVYLFIGQTVYRSHQFKLKKKDDDKLLATKNEIIGLLKTKEKDKSDEDIEIYQMSEAFMKAGGSFYTEENAVELFTEGEKKFKRMFDDLRKAEKFIHIEYYIIRNDKLSNEFMDILIEKVKAGVEVRLMIDAVGNNKGPKKKLVEFQKAGGEFTTFHKTITVLLSPKKNNRNHRKIAVIDGIVGYVGGFNIGDEYLGKGPLGYWRDSAVRVEGIGVYTMNLRFMMDWEYASHKELPLDKKYYPPILPEKTWTEKMQLISGGPDTIRNPIQTEYLKLINAAKKSIYIHTPYLIPDTTIRDALILAGYSGVDVRIIIPDKPDHPFVYWAGLAFAGQLIKDGSVRVYNYNRGFVHSKTMVVDGKYCSVGSANFDERSLKLNFETNAVVYSEKIGTEMIDAFMDDLKYCTEYTEEMYDKRSLWLRFKMGISRLAAGLL
ncbi:cardiolipin synthase [Methanolapillus millepedarum]|uniref:Cardiolipin synthase n=1 Tax=Methanolapillus millepedarum TaxID=3028296 RepID=A0AA96V467_9EURY|nr:Cardiolipin synthase [Methanosarcinaceae archaeon Ac7]